MVKITACPNCGSKDIKMGSLGDGVLYGIGSWKLVCKNCGYQGAPLSFNSVEEYLKYYNKLHPNQKKSSIIKKEITEDNKNNQKEKEQVIKTEELEEKGRWRVFLISVVFSILLTILFMPYYFNLFEPIFAMIALIGAFIGFLFFTVLILLFLRFVIKQKIS
jgi:transcription elongation factor Elf1